VTDQGYSTAFEVYLTNDKGVQLVTNDLSLVILKEMRYREISPSDIATELNVSKSTVQANITKLVRMGIVSQEMCRGDARRVIFRLQAILMFSSHSDTESDWQMYARIASDIRILKSGRCTNREDFALYAASLLESGFDIVQGLFAAGSALTAGMPDFTWNRIKKDIMPQSEQHGETVHVHTVDGLEIQIDSKDENIADAPLIVVPMLGAIVSHSWQLFGYNLSSDISLVVSNQGHSVDLLVQPFIGQEYENVAFGVESRTLDHYKVEEPFAVYSIGGVATLFTNKTMMGILYNLSNGDYSVNDLSDIMGVSRATIYSAITILVEMGAVEIDKTSGTPKCYTLVADPILYCTEPEATDCTRLQEVVSLFQSGKMDYYGAVISLSMETLRCMGIHFDKMFIRSGRSTARTVIDLHPNLDPQKLLEIGCNMVSVPDKAEVISLLPIKIKVTLDKNTLWESWPGDFVKGFVSEGLKLLIGDSYKITIETVREQ